MVVTQAPRLICSNIKRISIIMLSHKKLLTLKSLGLGIFCCGLFQTSAMGMSITLDSFDQFETGSTFQLVNTQTLDNIIPPASSTSAEYTMSGLTNVFGGSRTIRTTKLNTALGSTSVLVGLGEASISSDSSVIGRGEIIWDGISDTMSFVDITDSGSQKSIEVNIKTVVIGSDPDETNNHL